MEGTKMDDLMRFPCPTCGKRLKSPPQNAGRKARCNCGQQVVIPAPARGVEDTAAKRWAVAPAAMPVSAIQVATLADFTTPYEFRATVDELWQALSEYLAKLPAMQVAARDDIQHRLTFRDAGDTFVSIAITSTQEGHATVTFEEFQSPTAASSIAGNLPFLTAAVRTVAFQKFRQVSGPCTASETR
jgi:hypothetical protein